MNITEQEAIEQFHPERLKVEASGKVSKSSVQTTRWQQRRPGTKLAIITHNPRFQDLCWDNNGVWTYITTRFA